MNVDIGIQHSQRRRKRKKSNMSYVNECNIEKQVNNLTQTN